MTDPVDKEKLAEVVAEGEKEAETDPFLVTFTKPFDSDNPKDWPTRKKWMVTGVLSATGFTRIMVSTIMAPALPTIARQLHMSNIESVMSLSVFLLASAFGPLIIGPLSETYGRTYVLHVTNIWFMIWNLLCGFSYTKGLLISARLFAGLGASAIYALGAGVLGDVWAPEQRGHSLSLYMLIPLLAAGIGPVIGGFITQYTTWRWMYWSTSIVQLGLVLLSLVYYHETHGPTILHRKASHLRKTTNNPLYYTVLERFEQGRSISWILGKSLSRPVRLLLFHPIVQISALISGFQYGLTYLSLSTYSILYTKQYRESVSISGLHYLSLCLGEIAGAEVGGPLMDFTFRTLKAKYHARDHLPASHPHSHKRKSAIADPEFRLPLMIPGVLIIPSGLFLYGWAAHYHLHWIVVDIGAAIFAFGLQVSGMALQAYVIDAYPDHVSSASSAAQFLRSMAAFGFPLFAPKMYDALGYGWGNSLLAFAAVGVLVPAPVVLWVYGARLRERALSSY